jgi:hypothetical protein
MIAPGIKTYVEHDALEAVFDGLPQGMFRADVSLEKIVVNSHPSIVDSFSAAYNGRVGTYLRTAVANAGSTKLFAYNHGRISWRMPQERNMVDSATGWYATVFGFTGDIPYGSRPTPRFSEFISPGQKGAALSAEWAQWKGKRYLRVTRVGPPLGKDVILLDPRRAFSIARWDHYGWRALPNAAGHIFLVAGKRLQSRLDVRGFVEPAPGIFYPKKIISTGFTPPMSVSIKISKVTINDPKVNADTWVLKFPRGALIQDKATGRYIRIGGTPQQQLKEIEAAVKAAR